MALGTLLLLYPLLQELDERPFEPSLDASQRSATEWLEALRTSEIDQHDALWSLYWLDERTPPVVEELRLLRRMSPNVELARDAEAVLASWDLIGPSDLERPTRLLYSEYATAPTGTGFAYLPPEAKVAWLEQDLGRFESGRLPLSQGVDKLLRHYFAIPERAPHNKHHEHARFTWQTWRYSIAVEDEPLFADWAQRLLQRAPSCSAEEAHLVSAMHIVGSHSEWLRGRFTDTMRTLLEREDSIGGEALRALCHWGMSDEQVRRAYVDHLARRRPLTNSTLSEIPCLTVHDDETELALIDAIEGLGESELPFYALAVAAPNAEPGSPIANAWGRLLAKIDREPEHVGAWHALYESGYVADVLPQTEDSKIVQVHKLAISIRHRRSIGVASIELEDALLDLVRESADEFGGGGYEDCGMWGAYRAADLDLIRDEFLDEAIDLASTSGGSSFARAIFQVVDPNDLSRQQVLQAIASPWIDARFRYQLAGSAPTIEWASRWRELALAHGQVGFLEAAMEATGPVPADVRFIAQGLRRPVPGNQLRLLDLVEQFDLDTPSIVAAVEAARDGRDTVVAERAATLLESMSR